jgi:nucleoside 2-deoxyribosyltransferase
MTYIYIAGPLFNSHERAYLEQIATILEGAGYWTFLPHRDAGLLTEFREEMRTQIFRTDMEALSTCDACVALLTGPDHDSGTCAEIGYLYAKGIPVIGLTDDIRWLNNFIWGVCNEGKHLVRRIEDVLPLLTALVKP